jgi:anti-sigma regulatory factor (Ser/Thr protein kinase)
MDDPVEVELPRYPSSASRGRDLVGERFAATLDREDLDKAKLLVSELLTNAVLHGQGAITLRASVDENRLLVEVMDEGFGFERVAREHDFDQLGGLGLRIVDAEASRWGVHEGTTHVWFEIERSGPRVGTEQKPLPDPAD